MKKSPPQPQLVVISRAEASALPGASYTYAIDAVSTAGGVKYRIESGPDGMTVSDSGQVRWQIPATANGTVASVLVVLNDASGKEIFHTFNTGAVGKPGSAAIAAAVAPPDKPRRGKSPATLRPEASSVKPQPQKAIAADQGFSTDTIALPRRFDEVCCGGAGRYLFFHSKGERTLIAVDLVEGKIVRQIPLPSEHPLFAGGRDKLMIVFPDLGVVQAGT